MTHGALERGKEAPTVEESEEFFGGRNGVQLDPGRGRGSRLFRIARRNLLRRPEYTLLSIGGIGLAMAVVIVVQGISSGYERGGKIAVGSLLLGAPAWIVPKQGVMYDPSTRTVLPQGTLPRVPYLGQGWTVRSLVGGRWRVRGESLALFGVSDLPAGTVRVTQAGAEMLDLRRGDTLSIRNRSLSVQVTPGTGRAVYVRPPLAGRIVGRKGWATVFPPRGLSDLAGALAAKTGLPVTTDPSHVPGPRGIVYITKGGGGFFSFAQNFAGVLNGRAQSSILGIISRVALVLGFVIAVSTFLGALQERRREFGIMASVGLTDECLYFFLMESVIVFFAAYGVGLVIGFGLLLFAAPGQVGFADTLTAAGLVLTYLPAMAIFAALIPAHRLLQERPVDLLRGSAV